MKPPRSPYVREWSGRDATRLWSGILGPQLVFLLHLQAGYALAPLACRQGHSFSLHVASVIAIVLTLGLGMLSLTGWRRSGRHWPDSSASLSTRDRFLGLLGVMTTAIVVLTLIAQWIPVFLIEPCR